MKWMEMPSELKKTFLTICYVIPKAIKKNFLDHLLCDT